MWIRYAYIKNELDKLISYVGDRKEITSYDLEQLTSSQTINQIFIMLDAIARKQRDKVLTLYYDLIELKESPFGILALLMNNVISCFKLKIWMISAKIMEQSQRR